MQRCRSSHGAGAGAAAVRRVHSRALEANLHDATAATGRAICAAIRQKVSFHVKHRVDLPVAPTRRSPGLVAASRRQRTDPYTRFPVFHVTATGSISARPWSCST